MKLVLREIQYIDSHCLIHIILLVMMDLGNIGDLGLNLNNLFSATIVGPGVVPAGQQQQQVREKMVRLPEFWLHAPQIWFARAELQFEVNNVVDERQHVAYAANALSYDSVRLVADLITTPPLVSPYTVGAHRLFQGIIPAAVACGC